MPSKPPTQADAEAAVRTLIQWAGDDPDREGLKEMAMSQDHSHLNHATWECKYQKGT